MLPFSLTRANFKVNSMGFCLCFCFVFLGLHLRHMEFPRLRDLIRAVAAGQRHTTATWDLSCVCDLHRSSWQCWILNPLREAKDRTHNLMIPNQICFCCAMMGTPIGMVFAFNFCIQSWEKESSSRVQSELRLGRGQ